ncbi:S1 RNA-binding domain-containing protein [Chloroflexi bacterium TSY]|nr:S1 RNA-binding domain-containing protein [Chloroflexi bacterium TSY]
MVELGERGSEQVDTKHGGELEDVTVPEATSSNTESTNNMTMDNGTSDTTIADNNATADNSATGEENSQEADSPTSASGMDTAEMDTTKADAVEIDSSETTSDMELFEQYLEAEGDFDVPQKGDLREGTIVEVRSNELLVNIGVKRDGVVPQSDLNRLDQELVRSFEVGQTIAVVVSRTTDDGTFNLSISEAQQQKDWIEAQRLLETSESTAHKVIGFNKGGLTVEFNSLRGFVPASHVIDMPRNMTEDQRNEELGNRVGQEMNLEVIEVERRRRRLVMSQMLAERKIRSRRKEELFSTLRVGDVVEGEVRGMRPFGAFVDLGGADGLLHVSEIGWSPVAHPQNVLKKGEKLEVQVIRLDPDKQQIALSRKRLLPNPWDGIEERYQINDIVSAKITRVVDFGAFAQLEPGVEGLIHISELANISIAEPLKTVHPGDEIDVKILRIDPRRQRVGLSRRQAEGMVAMDSERFDESYEQSTSTPHDEDPDFANEST